MAVEFTGEAAYALRHLYFRLQSTLPGDGLARYRYCYSAVRNLMPVDTFYFGWYQPGNRLSLPFCIVDSRFSGPDVQVYGPHGMSAWIAASRRTYRWSHDNGRMVLESYPRDADDTRDALITPLVSQKSGEVVGMMGMVSSRSGAYDDRCVALAEWIAKALMVVTDANDETSELLDLGALFPGSAGAVLSDTAAVLDSVQVQLVGIRSIIEGIEEVPELPPDAARLAEKAVSALASAQDFIQRTVEENPAEPVDEFAHLSAREREVAMLIGRDKLSNAELAARLSISENTVKKHVSSVLRKLGVARREGIPAVNG